MNIFDLNAPQYQNWFVLHTESGKAEKIIQFVKKKLGNDFPIISFRRELIHYKNHAYHVVEKPLFPGYLFVHKHPDKVQYLVRDNFRDIYTNAVCFDGEPAKVRNQEMHYLFQLAGEGGKVELSKAYREGDGIVIRSGPLYNIQGQIRFIDQKKRRVNVSLPLLNTMVNVSLSYDLIEK